MTRNLKAFGLALVAAMAIGAIGAQGAPAVIEHSFKSDVEDTVLTGQNESYTTGSSREIWTFTGGLTLSCDVTYEGTQDGAAVRDHHTVHPKLHNCTSSLGGSPTIHTNGCNWTLDSDTTTNTHPAGDHAAVSLECETGHLIEFTASGCNFAFDDQHSGTPVNQSLHGVTYKTLSSSESHSSKSALTTTWTVRTMKYIATSGSLCGLAGHPAGTYSNGSLDAKTTTTGYIDSGVASGSTTTGFVWNSHSEGHQVNISIVTP